MNQTEKTPLVDLFSFYTSEDPRITFSEIATCILEDYPEVDAQLRHRSLRRYASQWQRGEKVDKEVLLSRPGPGHPTEGTSAQNPGTAQKIEFQTLGGDPITLEQAKERFNIDEDNYYVRNWWPREEMLLNRDGSLKATRWRYTLHVTAKKKPVDTGEQLRLDELATLLQEGLSGKVTSALPTRRKIGVVGLADIHGGAKVLESMHNSEFSYEVIIQKLANVARIINDMAYEYVVVNLLGDMIETFSGLNHPDSWVEIHGNGKGMGAQAVKTTYRILMDFLLSINNLVEVSVVSGNHDRFGKTKKDDPRGHIAELLAFMLGEGLEDVNVLYDPILISKPYDGIQYLSTHMHLPFVKKPMADIVLNYGDASMFNLLMGGHYHTKRQKKFYEIQGNITDTKNYRVEQVSPIFTGNFYSASEGHSGQSGFRIFERSQSLAVPNSFDFTV